MGLLAELPAPHDYEPGLFEAILAIALVWIVISVIVVGLRRRSQRERELRQHSVEVVPNPAAPSPEEAGRQAVATLYKHHN